MDNLAQLPVGQIAKITHLDTDEKVCIRFMEMGLCINEWVQVLGKLPLGGNLIVLSHYGKYILRRKEALNIKVLSYKADNETKDQNYSVTA